MKKNNFQPIKPKPYPTHSIPPSDLHRNFAHLNLMSPEGPVANSTPFVPPSLTFIDPLKIILSEHDLLLLIKVARNFLNA